MMGRWRRELTKEGVTLYVSSFPEPSQTRLLIGTGEQAPALAVVCQTYYLHNQLEFSTLVIQC